MTRKRPLPPKAGPQPLPDHPHVLAAWQWVTPPQHTGDSPAPPRLVYRRVVTADGLDAETRDALRLLRRQGFPTPPLLGDELPPEPGSTRRGVPADYDGTDPRLCNARTVAGGFCRALGLPNGRCVRHGGKSTGPRTPEGKRRVAQNLALARAVLAARRRG